MDVSKLHEVLKDYKTTESRWLDILETTNPEQLIIKPGPDEWSLGQVFSHWLDASQLYMLAKVRICLNNVDKHLDEGLSEYGKLLFATNTFPIEEAKVPVKTSGGPDNEGDKDYLRTRIKHLHIDVEKAYKVLIEEPPTGKSGHRLFGFMDAYQWFALIPIHMRHHLKQKDKIILFLNN